MSCKRWFLVLLMAGGVFSMTALAQVAPSTPKGFATRSLGGGSDVSTAPTTPTGNNTALLQTLCWKIEGLLRQQRYDEAEVATLDLLQRFPNDEHPTSYLRQIQSARLVMEAPLQKMIVPKVEFREATLSDVLGFLHQISGELAVDKKPVSFVFQAPPGAMLPTVTLSLQNVPMLDLIRYITATAGLSYKIEQHAVVIYKAQPPPAAPVATTTTP